MGISGSRGVTCCTCKCMEQSTSTEQYGQFCSPCSADGHNQDAFSYCSDCSEYLCQECCNIHGKVTLTKQHVLLHEADMPHGTAPCERMEDELTDPCPIRADKVIEHHCEGHNKTCTCTTCVSSESIGELVTKSYPYLSHEVNVKAPTDTKTCDIIGMVILEDGMLVLTDYNNKSVKLFDRKHVLTSRVPLQYVPFHIAEVGSGEVAVCMGYNNIQFVSVADTLTLDRVIKTAAPCYSVAPCGDRLAVCTCTSSPDEVVMLDRRGRKVDTVWTRPGGPDLRYVMLHPDNNDMYVSHIGGVTRVTLAGKVMGEYRDPDLDRPRGLTVHPDGSVYVCGLESHNIHHMTADCTKIEVLCGGQVVYPRSIFYNYRDNTLYVSERSKNTIKVFKLHD